MDNNIIFCDFDGTITKEDTVDKFLQLYAESEWIEVERLWEEGIIGSKECLKRQIACIKKITSVQIAEFVNFIEIDESFITFIEKIKEQRIPLFIVSDGFDLFINIILKKHKINDIRVFSNKLILEDGKLIALFPYSQVGCEAQAGLCKCTILKTNGTGKQIVYIGDGRSDMCASRHADILFAKGKLAGYCRDKGITFNQFIHFGEIVEELFARKEDYLDESGIIIG